MKKTGSELIPLIDSVVSILMDNLEKSPTYNPPFLEHHILW